MPNPRARLEDPITSHEAAEAVDVNRSQMIVLARARDLGEFTDQQLEQSFECYPPPSPGLSPSRIRSARNELTKTHRLIEFVDYTRPATGRRRCIWRAVSGAPGAPLEEGAA